MSDKKFVVSSTPHIRSHETIDKIMKDVLIALSPAALAGIYFFGVKALTIMMISVASAVLFEYLYQTFTKQSVSIHDCSAAVTGLLLAFNLPASSPVWLPILGALFAIIVVKQLFGGLGQNFMNPALAARAFLLASFPAQMTAWTTPSAFGMDAISSATPLALLKETPEIIASLTSSDYINAFMGNISGSIGETSALALLLGAAYLLYKKIINWRIPVLYIGTVFLITAIIGREGFFSGVPFYELFVGGLLLGAFYMATDYSSSPLTPKGQLIMGFGCGLLTAVIRVYGGYPEGVSYSILLMNLAVPLIDKFTKPRVFGTKKGGKK